MKVDDVDLENGVLTIRQTKFSKDRYDVSSIESIFRELLFKAGISHGGRNAGPRIHDFRHTFSVRCLKKWVLDGRNITSALPALSAYLGHTDLRGSEFYLRLTSDLYPNITCNFEKIFGDVIPE